jgi:glycosyltransferase involved in cell wall biosynthesis
MKLDFISIIVPAYNAQKTLPKCITSLINLDFPKDQYEIIIVDNNSTDKTAVIIKSFSEVIYTRETIQGRSYTRNHGAKISKGNILVFIDADVFLDSQWLKFLAVKFKKKSIGGGQGRVIPTNNDGQASLNNFRIRQQNEATDKTNIILRLKYFESPMVNSAACIYRKEAFELVGGFDVFLERHEDIDLAKRVCVAGYDLVAVPESCAYVEYHGEGWWSYFVRSYSEGYTKQSYNIKWRQYFNSQKNDIAIASSECTESSSKKKMINLEAIKMNFWMVRDEIFYNVLRTVVRFDFYYSLKAINSTFKSAGRVWGILRNNYSGEFVPRYRHDLLDRTLFVKEKFEFNLDDNFSFFIQEGEIRINENVRFVLQDNAVLYALNIKKNEFVNLGSIELHKKVLNVRDLLNQNT